MSIKFQFFKIIKSKSIVTTTSRVRVRARNIWILLLNLKLLLFPTTTTLVRKWWRARRWVVMMIVGFTATTTTAATAAGVPFRTSSTTWCSFDHGYLVTQKKHVNLPRDHIIMKCSNDSLDLDQIWRSIVENPPRHFYSAQSLDLIF